MLKYLILFISAFILVSCGQQNNKPKFDELAALDTSLITILPYDSTLNWVSENSRPTNLNSTEIRLIDSIINSCIANYNSEKLQLISLMSKNHPDIEIDSTLFLIDLKDYKRQYIPIENEQGERIVWANLFCGDFENSNKTKVLIVKDGGKCYFNLKINLKTGRYFDLNINGNS